VENYLAEIVVRWSAHLGQKEYRVQDAQKDRPARPQPKKAPEAYHFSPTHPKLPRQLVLRVGYVEGLNDARTKHGKGASRRAGVGRVRKAAVSAAC
jgi:hypothetical protein